MKRITLYIMSVVALLSSCSALEEQPTSFVQRENWYRTEDQCRASLNGCYPNLHNLFGSTGLLFAVEGVSDLFCTDFTQVDAMLDISPSYNGIAQTVWTNCYQGIMRCNDIVDAIENISPLPEEIKMPYAAEARVMRAYYYYILTNMFNGVPFYLRHVDSKETMEYIRNLGRTDANEIRATLREDLKENALPWFTEENGLKRRTCDVKGNRAGYALALMLMAKFDMWTGSYAEALGDVENPGPLALLEALYGDLTEANYPLGDIRWGIKNTPESIFELQNEYNTSGVMYYGKWAYVMQPPINASGTAGGSFDGSDMGWYFGNSVIGSYPLRATTFYAVFMPAGDGSTNENMSDRYRNALLNPLPLKVSGNAKDYMPELGRRKVVLDEKAVNFFMDGGKSYEKENDGRKIDRRVFYKLGMFGQRGGADGSLVCFNQVIQNGRPWAGPQFWRQNQLSNADGNNYKLLRYADAVLMTAECWCRLGNLEKAQEYLCKTRARAGVDPLAYSSQDEMLSNILDERARELGGELHRKWDLVRWGENVWYDRVRQYSESANGMKSNIRPYHRYYPIPDVECSLSKYKLTNDEYAKK